jgi:probable rRNA maturation factor
MSVFVADDQSTGVDLEAVKGFAEQVVSAEGFPPNTEVSVLLVSESDIADWNRRLMGGEGPTDVLAFPIEHLSPGSPPSELPSGPPFMLGDVLIAPTYVRRQAAALDVDFDDEIALMVVHGLLHLMGYDHEDDDEAEVMESRERHHLGVVGRRRR